MNRGDLMRMVQWLRSHDVHVMAMEAEDGEMSTESLMELNRDFLLSGMETPPGLKYEDRVIPQAQVDGLVKYLQTLGTHTIVLAEIEDGTLSDIKLRTLIKSWQAETAPPHQVQTDHVPTPRFRRISKR